MLLKETAQNVCLQVEPQNVLTDFEVALQQSVTILLSTSREKRMLLPLYSSHLEKSADSRVPTNLQG